MAGNILRLEGGRTEEAKNALKDNQGLLAVSLLRLAGHSPAEIAGYETENIYVLAGNEYKVPPVNFILLEKLRNSKVGIEIPDIVERAFTNPRSVFGSNFFLLNAFGHLLNQYTSEQWVTMLRSQMTNNAGSWRNEQAINAMHQFRHSPFKASKELGLSPSALEYISDVTITSFQEAANNSFYLAGARLENVPHAIDRHLKIFTLDAGFAAAEIQGKITDTKFLHLFMGPMSKRLSMNSLRGVAKSIKGL